jgi:hypothetical protein
VRHGTASALDELGRMKTFNIEMKGGKRIMRDAVLNIETYDFAYRDPVGGKLPGNLAASPWSPAAVSAHTHAAAVTRRFCARCSSATTSTTWADV